MACKRFVLVSLCLILCALLPLRPLEARGETPERRSLNALRVAEAPKIDGILSEESWKLATAATGFFQYEPNNDRAASLDTEVRVLYDDHNLYIGAVMKDPDPRRILMEMGMRDEHNLNADSFWIEINPFDDGIYGFSFKVSSSGVQGDANISLGAGSSQNGYARDEDRNWDSVWTSAVGLEEDGWVAEIRIPYSALRFPKKDAQLWGINFWREIRRSRETSSWNYVDRSLGNKVGSMGLLTGIRGVRPHLRLAFFPYVSGYLQNDSADGDWSGTFNGGMDIKYGLNESFTLDTILIPDFGQVQSDNLELNLTPYEIKYDEKRQFFTESTELFNKADLFYSRRIGGTPYGHDSVFARMTEHETLLSNPRETRLINAVKFSGRTAGGLGIGVFNALTAEARARVRDMESGAEREIVTQPLSNYTVLVLDQSLKNNSFISLVNASALGLAGGYSSNVTGTEFLFLDRSRSYRLSGTAALSQQYHREGENVFGYKYSLSLGRSAGTWQYGYSRSLVSDEYQQNDLGYLRRNNELRDTLSLSHNTFSPFWILNTMTHEISLSRNALFSTGQLASFSIGYNMRLLFRDRFMLMLNFNLYPGTQRDFYEPRLPGRYVNTHAAYDIYVNISSNYRNPIYLDGNLSYGKNRIIDGQSSTFLSLKPTFRLSDQIKLAFSMGWGRDENSIGFVRIGDDQTIHFGQRNGRTLVPGLQGTVMFTSALSLELNLRHYWSKVAYTGDYFVLKEDGELLRSAGIEAAQSINYNSFTLDLQLTWNFAPGSQLSLVWKNASENRSDTLIRNYFDNVDYLFNQPQVNSLSLKILYYLDHRVFARSKH